MRSRTLLIGCLLLGGVVGIATVSVLWTPYDSADISGGRLEPPGPDHWMGTDRLGRDLLTQLMIGARVALSTGIAAVAVGGALGLAAGILAGFAVRWLDDMMAVALDILIAFPTLLLAMLVIAARRGSLLSAVIAIGLAMTAVVARLTRLLVKRVLAQDYVTAARTSGTSWPRIVPGHVLPNIWPTLAVNLAHQLGLAVLAEASLSYLGLGSPPPNASWGHMLREAQATVLIAPGGIIAPGLLLALLVIGVNLMADGVREVADPVLRGRW